MLEEIKQRERAYKTLQVDYSKITRESKKESKVHQDSFSEQHEDKAALHEQ